MTKPNVFFVLGPPGAGKGTQSDLLVKTYGLKHLSAGDLLRAEQAREGPLAPMIAKCIEEGSLVPAEVTVELLKRAMEEFDTDKFLVDGFPRSIVQAQTYHRMLGDLGHFMLRIECPRDILVERLLERGRTSGRADDNIESIGKRFVTYSNDTIPVYKFFEENAGAVHIIDGNGEIDDVFAQIKEHFVGVLDPIV
ncbi:hypothetical protein PCE1_002177 [Barthelona sp. PCE]